MDFKESMDHQLLKKLEDIVENNFSNENFGVEELVREVGMSRSQMHRKLRTLTNKSISQYIREIRLEKAQKMLQQKVGTSAEISFLVGFNSPTYFNKCFHDYYGYPPGKACNITPTNSSLKHSNLLKYILFSFALLAVVVLSSIIALKRNTETNIIEKSIAVLPFADMSPFEDQKYFADAIQDDILTNLQKVGDLRVISRTSTEQYRNSSKNANEIGSELKIKYLLEGSTRKDNNQIILNTKLINTQDQSQIWVNQYTSEYTINGLLDIQKDIAANIVSELAMNITPKEVVEITQVKTNNIEAYDYYKRGMFYWYQLSKTSIKRAHQYFELAREKDPNYALAYAGIAKVWGAYVQQGYMSFDEAKPKIQEASDKALALDTSLVEIHYLLAIQNCWWKWNWEVSVREFQKTITLRPNFAEARAYYSHTLNILGYPEEADIQAKKAMEIESFNPLVQAIYGQHLNFMNKNDEAIKVMENLLITDPRNDIALSNLRSSYHNKKMYEKAIDTWEKFLTVRKDYSSIVALKRGYKEGGYSMALQRTAEHFIARSDTSFVSPWQIATLYIRAGLKQEALYWLEKAFEYHDPNIVYIGIDPIFNDLRDEHQFKNILTQLNLPLNSNNFDMDTN